MNRCASAQGISFTSGWSFTMKKLFALLVVAGLGLSLIGCADTATTKDSKNASDTAKDKAADAKKNAADAKDDAADAKKAATDAKTDADKEANDAKTDADEA